MEFSLDRTMKTYSIAEELANIPHILFSATDPGIIVQDYKSKMAQQEALKKEVQKRKGHYLVIKRTINKVKELLPLPEQTSVPHETREKVESLRTTLEKK